MTQLFDYQAEVEDLLHDPSQQTWTVTQISNYINRARTKVVTDTGCLRSLQSAYVMQGDESYDFGTVWGAAITAGGAGYSTPTVGFSGGGGSGVAATLGVSSGAVTSISFTNNGSGYTSAPAASITGAGSGATIAAGAVNVNTYDVLGISLIWGQERISLLWRPWSKFSELARQWVGLQRRPVFWACYGETTIFVGPLPDQTYQVELDTVVLPTALTIGTDVDPIPVLMQPPIAYKAAELAMLNQRRFGEAMSFANQYEKRMYDVSNAYVRRITSG